MTGYTIRRLPENSIGESLRITKNEKRFFRYYIKDDTFFKISDDLPIRPKAVSFIERNKDNPIYVVFNDDPNDTCCLFLFTFTSTIRNTSVLNICRCTGRTKVKKHWKDVLKFIESHSASIEGLLAKKYISLSFEEKTSD